MKNAKSVDDGKFYRIETWMDEYGATVLQCAVLYTGDGPKAEAIFARTFAYAYRRLDLSHLFLTDQNAVFAALVAACKWSDEVLAGTTGRGASSTDGRDCDAVDRIEAPQSGEEASDESVRLLGVSPDYRITLLLRTVAALEVADLTRILLVPRRWIKNRLTAGICEFDPTANGALDDTLASIRATLAQRVELVTPDEELRERTRKVLKATVQELRAQNRHRGPRWLKYATVTMGLVSILAVDFGVHRNTAATVNRTNTTDAKKAAGLPAPLTNLPVNTEAQFGLSSIPDTSLLDHAIPSMEGIYFPSLQQAANNWPSIQLQYVPYSASGKNLQTAIQSAGAISMVPPMVKVSSGGTGANTSLDWKVSGWQFDVSGNWAFATVRWQTGKSQQTVTQVYGLYLPTGQSNLMQTLGAEPSGDSDTVVVAAGDDKLVVQTGVKSPGVLGTTNSSTGNGAPASGASNNESSSTSAGSAASHAEAGSVVALPIDVYRLTGTTPLQALVKAGQIPAPFGLMQDPTVFSSGIVFSHPSSAADANTDWYLVSWDGDATKYAGPPNDGQRHFVVTGSGGDLWWVETTPTPSGSQMGAWQVVMAPLGNDASAEKAQAITLSSPVAWFTAYKSEVCWIQDTDGRMELVASAMQ